MSTRPTPSGRPASCDCGTCKKCRHRLYMRDYYRRASLEKRREWIAGRNPESVRANRKAWYERHKVEQPTKRHARMTFNNAVRDGRVEREPCEVCGMTPAHGHHDDYERPFEVRWLCQEHHQEEHRGF